MSAARRRQPRDATRSRDVAVNLKPGRPHEEPEINVVSLIDVPADKVSSEPLVVSVTETGGYLVNGRELINSSPETLRAALLKEAGTQRSTPVTLRADARATHQAVITAMDVLGRLGFAELNIATVKEEPAGKP